MDIVGKNGWYSSIISREIERHINLGKPANSQSVFGTVNYALENKYKSFYRPKLALACGKIVGLGEKEIITAASGVEFIHTASLIFDDLPCMDNADTRRDKEAVHIRCGESSAILAAIYLSTKGYSLVIENAEKRGLVSKIRKELEETCHFDGLIGGQEKDLFARNINLDLPGFLNAYFQKNRLIYFSAIFPSLLGGDRYKSHFQCLGKNLALAYQFHDDLRDFKSKEITGKNEKNKHKKIGDLLDKDELIVRRDACVRKSLVIANGLPNSNNLVGLLQFIFYKHGQ